MDGSWRQYSVTVQSGTNLKSFSASEIANGLGISQSEISTRVSSLQTGLWNGDTLEAVSTERLDLYGIALARAVRSISKNLTVFKNDVIM